MKLTSMFVFLIGMFMVAGYAFADTVAVAAPDLTASLLALWSAIQNHSATALILVPVFQILKSNQVVGLLSHLSGKGFQIAVALITSLGFVVNAWASGQSLGQAAVTGLFTAGGAMLMYDAIRGITPPSA